MTAGRNKNSKTRTRKLQRLRARVAWFDRRVRLRVERKVKRAKRRELLQRNGTYA